MATSSSRLVIAGLSGDSGKTIASLSAISALRRRGLSVSAFKKGPDYIDSAWLSYASQSLCRNLDTYMVDRDVVLKRFVVEASSSDIAVIEGNRGVHDGRDAVGTHSTAELAKLLHAPVVLVVNVSKSTRTVAAIVKGCVDFDPDVNIAGVILNRVAGERHERVLRDSVEAYNGIPVLGAIPKLRDDSSLIPGRHLGLVTPAEHRGRGGRRGLESRLLQIADDHLDLDGLLEVASAAGEISCADEVPAGGARDSVRIGYFKDTVFTFYYPENLEALEANGARLVPVSSLDDDRLPDVDALYIGGGFPETHAEQLAGNRALMAAVKEAALRGMPVYAECGGLIYLSRSLQWNDAVYPMAGLFPIDLAMHKKPVGHGYTQLRVDAPNPFFAVGEVIRGHEFHYSGPCNDARGMESCMSVESGVGVGAGRDGLTRANTVACYTHVHSDGVESWARTMVSKARDYAKDRRDARSAVDGEQEPKSEAI